MTGKWNTLAKALSMPYNNRLMYELKIEAAQGKEFVTVTCFPPNKYFDLNFSGVYSSDESDSHYVGHTSFETKYLLTFIEQMKGEMSQRLCLALLTHPIAMGGATKLSHDSTSKQFLAFSFSQEGIFGAPWLTNIPETFNEPGVRNASCSVTEFRAWRRSLFEKRKNANVQI